MRSTSSGSSDAVVDVKPDTCGGRRAMEYYFMRAADSERPCLIRGRERQSRNNRRTLHANRGNAKDCFAPFGMNTSPRSIRTPGSPAPTFASPSARASCGQKTPFATPVTNVLLLRRRPASAAASEPIVTVRSRCRRGALTSRSSACTSVPRSVRSRGIGELLAYANWSSRAA
jgi:hypothetical protein